MLYWIRMQRLLTGNNLTMWTNQWLHRNPDLHPKIISSSSHPINTLLKQGTHIWFNIIVFQCERPYTWREKNKLPELLLPLIYATIVFYLFADLCHWTRKKYIKHTLLLSVSGAYVQLMQHTAIAPFGIFTFKVRFIFNTDLKDIHNRPWCHGNTPLFS